MVRVAAAASGPRRRSLWCIFVQWKLLQLHSQCALNRLVVFFQIEILVSISALLYFVSCSSAKASQECTLRGLGR